MKINLASASNKQLQLFLLIVTISTLIHATVL
jgi:hypothetical protein